MDHESILRYSQIPLQFLKSGENATITAVAMSSKDIIVIGTSAGRVISTNLSGSQIVEYMSFSKHVTSISFTPSGDTFLATSLDGNARFYTTSDPSPKEKYENSSGPILVGAIDPDYDRHHSLSFLYADATGTIFQVSKGLFYGSSTTTLSAGSGILQTLIWTHGFYAWASHTQIVIRMQNSKTNLYTIEPELPKQFSESPKCTFLFLDDAHIGVSFGSFFYELHLLKNQEVVVNMCRNVISMAYSNDTTMQIFENPGPVLYVDQNNSQHYMSLPSTVTALNGSTFLAPTSNGQFVLVANQYIYSISFYSWSERIQSLLDRDVNQCLETFDEILPSLSEEERVTLTLSIARHFISIHEQEKGAQLCAKYLKNTPEEWDRAIKLFQTHSQLRFISPKVPVEALNHLPNVVEILLNLLDIDSQRFCQVFEMVDETAFQPERLINEVAVKAENEKVFNIPLMYLFHRKNDHKRAFDYGLAANYLKLFEDIEKYGLYSYVLDRFHDLYQTYGNVFTKFLLTHTSDVSPKKVLTLFTDQSQQMQEHKLEYMDKLLKMDKFPKEFCTDLARLYIMHHHPDTMKFLKTHFDYDYNKVRDYALERQMYPEAAYLYRKTGGIVDGMKIHLKYIKIPEEAVQYAMQVDDKKVWSTLEEAAYKDAPLLSYMLDVLPSLNVNFVEFMQGIPEEMAESIGFAQSAEKIIKEFRRRLTTANLTQEIVATAAFELFGQQFNNVRRGTIMRK